MTILKSVQKALTLPQLGIKSWKTGKGVTFGAFRSLREFVQAEFDQRMSQTRDLDQIQTDCITAKWQILGFIDKHQ